MRRLYLIVGLALIAAFAGNALALIQQTMAFFNIGFRQALDENFWSLVRIGSRFGDIWNFRMIFLGVVAVMFGASLYFRKSQPESVRAFWTASAWMMALVVGSFSVLSHAAGSLILPWVGVTVDWLHALGVGFWAGGLAALVLVCRRAAPAIARNGGWRCWPSCSDFPAGAGVGAGRHRHRHLQRIDLDLWRG
jgi:putative copper export protein